MRQKVTTKHVLIIFAIQMILSVLFGVVIVLLKNPELSVLLNYALSQLSIIIAILFIVQLNRLDFFDAVPLKRKINIPMLLLMPIVAVALIAQNTLLMSAFVLLMDKFNITLNVPLPDMSKGPVVAIFSVIIIGILPSIVEEVFFRGVVLSPLKNKGKVYAILVSSLIFSLAHMNLAQLVHQFIVGIVLAYIVLESDNIWYAVVVHLTNNIIALFISNFTWYENLADMSKSSIISMVIMMVVGCVVLVGVLVAFEYLNKKFKKPSSSDAEADKDTLEKITRFDASEEYKEVVYTGTGEENIEEENRIIDKALENLKKKPGKLVDIYVLSICLFLAIMTVITTIASLYL
ncbi:MAG TPA: type II CAAX endopeptidase family protein [Clostridia bacterium]|jgi:membrane protease YdiL (CAAX protease family)|nr:type II CAAX endopeptidase family protein [Clostridia bacterium]